MSKFRRFICGALAVFTLFLTVACGGEPTARTTDPSKLGTLAVAVETAAPGEADRLLAKEGHDETSFRNEIELVMADPHHAVEFTAAYDAARK